MYRKFLLPISLLLGSTSLMIGGPIRVETIGTSLKEMQGCTLFYCVAPGLYSGYTSVASKIITKAFDGANQISTSLPSQFTAALQQGALTNVASVTASASSNSAPAQVGQLSDTSTYYLANGQVQQRGASVVTTDSTDSQSVITDLPAVFNLYSTSIVAGAPAATKSTTSSSSSDSSTGSMASLGADPSTGGSTSSGSGGPVVPTVSSGTGAPEAAAAATSGYNTRTSGAPNGLSVASLNDPILSSDLMMADAPEPSAEVMLGIGLLAVGFATRISRQKQHK
jgi:hypothetical protein